MTRVFCSVAMAILPTVGYAGFEVIDGPAEASPPVQKPALAPAQRTGTKPAVPVAGGFEFMGLNQIGIPDRSIAVISGFGRDVRLIDAIQQIAPSGWQVYIKDELLSSQPRSVSWKGGRRWIEVLDILATDHALVIDVDWAKRGLFVGSRKAAPQTGHGASSLVWVAKTGSTLRESLAEWGKRAGWQVVWTPAIDYPIAAQMQFDGSFLDAITAVFRAYEKAEKPLLVDVHQAQKLVVVSVRK